MIKIYPLPAFHDNYIWILINEETQQCVIVDPGDASVVETFLNKNSLSPTAILITHHHWDHTNGIEALCTNFNLPVYGPDTVSGVNRPLKANDKIKLPEINSSFDIIAIPGHTLDHIAYYQPNIVFCGDTLFAGGCGRLFEGSPEQLYNSLQQLVSLGDDTLIYSAHEYTQANLKFANQAEPGNQMLIARLQEVRFLRDQLLPTLPSNIKIEKQTNPFLRCEIPEVKRMVENYTGKKLDNPVEVFAALRQWKNKNS